MLTQATGNAACALGYLAATGGGPELIKTIAEACDIPAPYLAKTVHALARAGIVATQRGIGGGVRLTRNPSELSLYELCEVFDDPAIQPRCILGSAVCSDARACPAHAFNVSQRELRLDFLRSMTISKIAAFESKRRWDPSAPPTAEVEPADPI
ncbi:MAG: transcriptional regulator [Phycisphaeraceae bacterium]|nr:MAG: transcriptional regulator [Phycisphaeraceae bacterium]